VCNPTADLILVLEDGAVVARGTHHNLVADGGRYAALVYRQDVPRAVGSQPSGAALPPAHSRPGSALASICSSTDIAH
jgi:hypothetical protein